MLQVIPSKYISSPEIIRAKKKLFYSAGYWCTFFVILNDEYAKLTFLDKTIFLLPLVKFILAMFLFILLSTQ